ncbi:MAG TPA: hypothetical protein VFG06_07235, partial [Thermodesulfovibrionales bacterium]|nr:hypothetical protein [Thermodesulfovibrionales bacterium]
EKIFPSPKNCVRVCRGKFTSSFLRSSFLQQLFSLWLFSLPALTLSPPFLLLIENQTTLRK